MTPASHRPRGCVTPVQIANINEVIEHDTENFDGFAEIEDEHVKEKIKRAIHDGHVDDEDWRGVRLISVSARAF